MRAEPELSFYLRHGSAGLSYSSLSFHSLFFLGHFLVWVFSFPSCPIWGSPFLSTNLFFFRTISVIYYPLPIHSLSLIYCAKRGWTLGCPTYPFFLTNHLKPPFKLSPGALKRDSGNWIRLAAILHCRLPRLHFPFHSFLMGRCLFCSILNHLPPVGLLRKRVGVSRSFSVPYHSLLLR